MIQTLESAINKKISSQVQPKEYLTCIDRRGKHVRTAADDEQQNRRASKIKYTQNPPVRLASRSKKKKASETEWLHQNVKCY